MTEPRPSGSDQIVFNAERSSGKPVKSTPLRIATTYSVLSSLDDSLTVAARLVAATFQSTDHRSAVCGRRVYSTGVARRCSVETRSSVVQH